MNVSDPVGSTPHILHSDCPIRNESGLNGSSEVEVGGNKSAPSRGDSSISSENFTNGSRSDHSYSPGKCPIGGPDGTNLNGPHYLSQLDVDRITWGAEQVCSDAYCIPPLYVC